ncbi:uncharacterized protein LOC121253378 [Juglans microcarpa x Juglans regia]|uniref:uncharacterized protein LOC121253378 n=1 Tax=Juglans microcarpa x Juglans regia TaxID=2249226 RepID=UPI001B7E1936|nr:uncharacterized protein LOC121253378 [Juglans microcarpa x Juglans regia]
MAEGTRQAQLSEAVSMLTAEAGHLREEQSRQKGMLEAVLQQLNNLAASYDQLALKANNRNSGEGSSNVKGQFNNPLFEGNGGIHTRSLRIDFPKFNGVDPVEWILKAEQFFEYFNTPEDQKIQIAFFHMEGKALSWFSWLKDSGTMGKWEEFTAALRVRFGPSIFEDPIGAFTKLRQTSAVEDYQTEFEILSNKIKGLSDEFRNSTFISGLRDDLKIMVTMLKPNTISAAFGLAKSQEEEVAWRSRAAPNRTQNPSQPTQTYLPKLPPAPPILILPAPLHRPENITPQIPYNPNRKPIMPIKRITPTQMQERRETGLYYYCDEKFHIGHKCNKPKLFLLEGIEEGESDEFEEGKLAIVEPKEMDEEFKEMGSTHSFVDPYVARKLKQSVEESQLTVKVVNGDSLPCQGYCRIVPIQLQSLKSMANLYLLTLGGCDVGLQPLKEALEVVEDVSNLQQGTVKGMWLQLIGETERQIEEPREPMLEQIMKKFEDVFSKPKGLPPPWSHDHKIELLEGAKPTCVRPYSKSLKDHVKHLQVVLDTLRFHQLYAKESKCVFGCSEVEYLGHLISKEGVKTDPHKISAMQQWLLPRNLKALRGFLGLTRYYRKFVRNYGAIAAPLTALLKKNVFMWSDKAQEAFERLKAAMVSPPVLNLPDFSKRFVVEYDALGEGLGAVLMQDKKPIAYLSQGLKGRSLSLSTYEKELLALVMTIRKLRHYLLGQHFKVRTNQQALKYLQEQRVGIPAQQKWVSKLLGYDFSVEYKSGKTNQVADALSRLPSMKEPEIIPQLTTSENPPDTQSPIKQTTSISSQIQSKPAHTQVISLLQTNWIKELKRAYLQNP